MAVGRPRAFDLDKALDQAMHVFWRRGYEGTSVADLIAAMGINPPSLYAAFGNKEELFRKALDRYMAERTAFWEEAFEAPTARGMVEKLLHGTADFLSDPRNPRGCLGVQGALACGEAAQSVREELAARRAASQARICERLKRAKTAGDLPAGAHPAALARFVAAMIEGMAVQAASGASRKELHALAKTALGAWPKA